MRDCVSVVGVTRLLAGWQRTRYKTVKRLFLAQRSYIQPPF